MYPLSSFGRFEYIDNVPFTENTQQTIRTQGGVLPSDRFLSSLILQFRGRATMPASSGPSGVEAEGVYNVIERVTVEGYHRARQKQEKFIDLRGVDLWQLQRYYLPSLFPASPTTLSTTASATNDIDFTLMIPFTPLRMPVHVQSQYLLDAPNYDGLKLTVQWGDTLSIFTGGTANPTWSAFGSSSGTPELRVFGQFALQATRFAGFVPGRVWRYFQEVTGSLVTTTATGVRLADLPKGHELRSILLKSGTKSTGITAGNNAFATLTEYLDNINVNLGLNKPIRRYRGFDSIHWDVGTAYNLAARNTGIALIDFSQYGLVQEALNTRPLVAGASGNADLYLSADVSGSSNQALMIVYEEWREKPLSFVRR